MCQLPRSNEYHSRASWKPAAAPVPFLVVRVGSVLVALRVVLTHCPSRNLSTSSFTPGSMSWFGPAVQYSFVFEGPHKLFQAPRVEQVALSYWKSPRARRLSSSPESSPAMMPVAFFPDAEVVDVFPEGFMSPTAAMSHEPMICGAAAGAGVSAAAYTRTQSTRISAVPSAVLSGNQSSWRV